MGERTATGHAIKPALAALALLASFQASASSTRGMVVDMRKIEGTKSCELVIDDEDLHRRLYLWAEPQVCELRDAWVGKRAVFHLSLVDVGGKLEPVATRVGPWPPKQD